MKILNLYAGIGGNRKLWGDDHENTFDTANSNAMLSESILNFCLEFATTAMVQKAVREFRLVNIAYDLKIYIKSEFTEINDDLSFGVAVSDAFEKFKTDQILLINVNRDLDAVRNWLKLMGKYHPNYSEKVLLHDALVETNNRLNEPINEFLKLYKKAQKKRGKIISVRMKKQPKFSNPFQKVQECRG